MKLKKFINLMEDVYLLRIWGIDGDNPLFYGYEDELPHRLMKMKVTGFEIRDNCSDIENHLCIFVEER